LLRSLGYPVGNEWTTIVIICSTGMDDPASVVKAFQLACPGAAIIGGIAEGQVLVHSRGRTRIEENCAVGLALRGDVPLTALVSRGCMPLTPHFRCPGAEVLEGTRILQVPELVLEDGSRVAPMTATRPGAMFVGRRLGAHGGFLLTRYSFSTRGVLLIPLEDDMDEGNGQFDDCEVCFYRIDQKACEKDLEQLLGFVQGQCEEREEETLGAVMFTCCARVEDFFGRNHAEVKQFQAVFPSLPLTGIWSNGEIGPQALVESAPEQATRTGNASMQGFTAVFGIFRAPASSAYTRRLGLAALGDEDVPAAVGAVLARWALEAKRRGEVALSEGSPQDACTHFARAAALAALPSTAQCLPAGLREELEAMQSLPTGPLSELYSPRGQSPSGGGV